MNPTVKTVLVTIATIALVFRIKDVRRLVTGQF